MPIPLSFTARWKPAASADTLTRISPPAGVNFIAFESRFKTMRSRWRSSSVAWTPSGASTASD